MLFFKESVSIELTFRLSFLSPDLIYRRFFIIMTGMFKCLLLRSLWAYPLLSGRKEQFHFITKFRVQQLPICSKFTNVQFHIQEWVMWFLKKFFGLYISFHFVINGFVLVPILSGANVVTDSKHMQVFFSPL